MLDVIFHRVLGDIERIGNLFVREALHDQFEHLQFSRTERRMVRAPGKRR